MVIPTPTFFHIYGMLVILNGGIRHGATIVTMPRFELPSFLQLLETHRVTRGCVVPPVVLALAKHPAVDNHDLSALRDIVSAAAPLDADLSRAAAERIGCPVRQGYGLTETSPVVAVSDEDPGKICLGSAGQLVPNTECVVVDPLSGERVGAGVDGEVWIRGPQVMLGYLNDPEATAETITEDGWLRSGDVGHFDEGGNLFIVDRLKEMIKFKGMQVAPAEIEALLLTHPEISDAAVIPKPDEEAGEVPKACVVVKSALSPEEVMEFVAGQVAPHKRVRDVEIVTEIPKSPTGKILRRVLIERDRASE